MNKLGITLILFAATVFAQAQSSGTNPEKPPQYRLHQTNYLKGQRAIQVGQFVTRVSEGVEAKWEDGMRAIVLYNLSANGTYKERLDKAEALVERLDVPEPATAEKEIEVTIQLVRAYSDARGASSSVPPDLEPVVKQMKGALPYSGFKLVDTIQAMAHHGLALQDALGMSVPGAQYFYNLEFRGVDSLDAGKTLRITDFHFGIKVPVAHAGGMTYQDESITTPLTLKEGQKLVLGKLKFAGDDLFVVLSSKAK